MLLAWAVATAGDDIKKSPDSSDICRKNYLKLIVEWFRRIEAERTGPLRKR
jgi:hypothetical protein